MAHEKICLGIIGANIYYGWGTRAHLPALTHLPDYELVDVCMVYSETAQEAAQAYGVPLTLAIRTGKRVELDFATAVTRHQLIEAVQTASDQGERVTLQVG